MRKNLTIRNLPEDVAAALEREKLCRGASLNQTVIELLRVSLGAGVARRNGLSRLAGTWTEAEHTEFLTGTKGFGEIDQKLWQ
jgi:hypothetical protein